MRVIRNQNVKKVGEMTGESDDDKGYEALSLKYASQLNKYYNSHHEHRADAVAAGPSSECALHRLSAVVTACLQERSPLILSTRIRME